MNPLSEVPRPNDMDADYTPAYMKLARLLRDQIRAGAHAEGDRLPSAKTLVRQYGVSRATALHALEVLAANNYAARAGGSGRYRAAAGTSAGATGAGLRASPGVRQRAGDWRETADDLVPLSGCRQLAG